MRLRRRTAAWIAGLLICALAGTAVAHWCSNIFTARARLVVKPEKTTVVLSSTPTQLRVYLQNNFPYRIDGYMRATLSGSTILPTPQHQFVYPGQNVSYIFTLTGSGSTAVSTLNLQVKFRTTSDISSSPWRSETDSIISPTPTQSNLVSASSYSGNQAASLNAAVLGDLYPSATLGTGTAWTKRATGLENIIHHFGYGFCY